MRDGVWYSEELKTLILLMEAEIKRTDPADFYAMVGLGGLHQRLESELATAPSMRTKEASA